MGGDDDFWLRLTKYGLLFSAVGLTVSFVVAWIEIGSLGGVVRGIAWVAQHG